MNPDPDSPAELHGQDAYPVPPLCVFTGPGRAYARRRVARMVRRHCKEQGYAPPAIRCFHFGVLDGTPAVVVHFTTRDALATAYAATGAEQ